MSGRTAAMTDAASVGDAAADVSSDDSTDTGTGTIDGGPTDATVTTGA